METITVVRGKLKYLDPVAGYGFVVPDSAGPDVFLLHSVLKRSGFGTFIPGAGCGLEVETVDRGRGPIAIRVRWVEWCPAEAMPYRNSGGGRAVTG